MITVKQMDAWLKRHNVESIQLARHLNVSKFAISKWRERGTIPERIIPILRIVLQSDGRFLRPQQSPRTRELFE